MDRKPPFPKTIPDCPFPISTSKFNKPSSQAGDQDKLHPWLSGSLWPCSLPLLSVPSATEGTEPHSPPPLPPHALPFSFHSRVNTSPLRAKKKEITQPRCRQCSPVCQGEERREIKANKTSKGKNLQTSSRVPGSCQSQHRRLVEGGKPVPSKTQAAVESGIHRPTRLQFQGRDRRPPGLLS